MTQNQQTSGGAQTFPTLTLPTGRELYDVIMAQIEPELTSKQLPTLPQKYATETPDEAQERQARYDRAFAEYGKRFATFSEQLSGQVHAFQHIAVSAAEMSTKADEADGLAAITASIASA